MPVPTTLALSSLHHLPRLRSVVHCRCGECGSADPCRAQHRLVGLRTWLLGGLGRHILLLPAPGDIGVKLTPRQTDLSSPYARYAILDQAKIKRAFVSPIWSGLLFMIDMRIQITSRGMYDLFVPTSWLRIDDVGNHQWAGIRPTMADRLRTSFDLSLLKDDIGIAATDLDQFSVRYTIQTARLSPTHSVDDFLAGAPKVVQSSCLWTRCALLAGGRRDGMCRYLRSAYLTSSS